MGWAVPYQLASSQAPHQTPLKPNISPLGAALSFQDEGDLR